MAGRSGQPQMVCPPGGRRRDHRRARRTRARLPAAHPRQAQGTRRREAAVERCRKEARSFALEAVVIPRIAEAPVLRTTIEQPDPLADGGVALHLLPAFRTLVQLLPPPLSRFVLGHMSSC